MNRSGLGKKKMNQTQNLLPSRRVAFTDYEPAELQNLTSSNEWRIVYRVREPGTDRMKRFRKRVKKMANKTDRLRFAKRLCASINEKLAEGWTPYTDGTAKGEHELLVNAIKKYIDDNEKLLAKDAIRPDTYKSYNSFSNILLEYIKDTKQDEIFCIQFNRQFVVKYLDHKYFEKGLSSRTVNNYLRWCNTLSNYMVDQSFIAKNNIGRIPTKVVAKKKRELIDSETRKKIFSYLKKTNVPYLTLCLCIYFCFIRRTELTKLKVKDVKLIDGVINLPASISKNKKDETVTIPKKLIHLLANHINGSTNDMYLFSEKNFLPGTKKLKPKKVSDTWSNLRKALKFKDEYQFYSLKDTGITQLFLLNLSLIKIRDQARHHDIKITESYTPRRYDKDELLASVDFDF
ncbi:integrase/recombinase [unidentified eubacterium SCB49]|nr:integrase/recombinase [unidentified eubacterium SCB49]